MLLTASLGNAGASGVRKVARTSNVRSAASKVNAAMAAERKLRDPRAENVPGDFYVDSTCIDCDTCRWMAPETYTRMNQQTAVHEQPQTPEARKRALQALLACPTHSIHATHKEDGEMAEAVSEMPILIPGTENCFHLVMASEDSYGATAYMIRRPQGNIMIDSPRFDLKLLKQIQAMGGIKYMCLSHRDDVSDHAKWAEALGCDRILHKDECNPGQGTDQVEVKLEGSGTFSLPDGSDDLDIVMTPGHTEAHACFLYKPDRVLFSGDHWGYSSGDQRGSLFRRFNWYSLDLQMDSLAALKQLDFTHVLPGHGRRMIFKSRETKDAFIDLTIEAEKAVTANGGSGSSVFAGALETNLNTDFTVL